MTEIQEPMAHTMRQAMTDDQFMFLLPILCWDCGEPIGDKQIAYTDGRAKGETHESLMKRFGYDDRYCCAAQFTSPIQIPYGAKGKPIGSISETTVSPDMVQIWSGTMSMAPVSQDDADIIFDRESGVIEITQPGDDMVATFERADEMTFGDMGGGDFGSGSFDIDMFSQQLSSFTI